MNRAGWLTYERAVVLGLFVFGALVFGMTFGIDTSTAASTDVGPTFVPRIFSGLLMACSLLAVFFAKPVEERPRPLDTTLFACIGVIVLYALAMPRLGYVVSTILALGLILAIVRAGAWWRIAIFAVAMTATTYFIFEKVLTVGLPPGPWGF
jgi:putative tricarboxylic transport membrane protein